MKEKYRNKVIPRIIKFFEGNIKIITLEYNVEREFYITAIMDSIIKDIEINRIIFDDYYNINKDKDSITYEGYVNFSLYRVKIYKNNKIYVISSCNANEKEILDM